VRGEINIRAFLLGLENLDEIRRRVDHGSPYFACAKVTLDNLEIVERAQRPPEHQLPDGLAGILGQHTDFGRKKLRGDDLVARKRVLDESNRIQPTQWCAFDRAVKEIETVNIEDGFQAGTSFSTGPVKNARAASEETAPRSAVETNRRDVPQM
jgi:hypothetical protein